jgi:hypothetical protein
VAIVSTKALILNGLCLSSKLIEENGLKSIPPSFTISINSQLVFFRNGFNCSGFPSPL